MRIRLALVSTAALSLLLAASALAQQPPGAAPQNKLSAKDANFAREAAIGGMFEVEMGKIAANNAQDNEVKQFGTRMAGDHGKANNQLQTIASQKGLNLPQQLDAKHKRQLEQLSRMQGDAFDRAYMRDMVRDHDADMKVFQKEAQTGADPDIKNFAQSTLAVIQQHDQMAHQIDQSLTAVGSSRRR